MMEIKLDTNNLSHLDLAIIALIMEGNGGKAQPKPVTKKVQPKKVVKPLTQEELVIFEPVTPVTEQVKKAVKPKAQPEPVKPKKEVVPFEPIIQEVQLSKRQSSDYLAQKDELKKLIFAKQEFLMIHLLKPHGGEKCVTPQKKNEVGKQVWDIIHNILVKYSPKDLHKDKVKFNSVQPENLSAVILDMRAIDETFSI